SIWQLPILFVVENNGIAQTTPTAQTTAGSIAARGQAFGLDTTCLSDEGPNFLYDVEAVIARTRARRTSMLVSPRERMRPHSKGDDVRDAVEMARIHDRDPLQRVGRHLDPSERESIDFENREFIGRIHREALASPPASSLVSSKSICFP